MLFTVDMMEESYLATPVSLLTCANFHYIWLQWPVCDSLGIIVVSQQQGLEVRDNHLFCEQL